MVFSSLPFIFLFLPLNLLAYFFAKDIKQKNTVMLVFSLIFYAWGEPVYILLLVGMTLTDWYLTLIMSKYENGSIKAKLFLGLTISVDLVLLGIFKYGSFILSNIKFFTGFPAKVPSIMLPIGISFYTFQLITYCVDVYRGDVRPQRSFKTLLLYVSLFHQCIAGPIVRYKDICAELEERRASQFDIAEGINRFTVGLAKKAIIANTCAALADTLLVPDGGDFSLLASKSVLSLWVGVLAFTLQIYIDFSAYSDMAIGLGRIFGFRFCENFNYPYISASITEFWRRWHISLGSWFRDYLYIPLGGNRVKPRRHIFNILVVWAATGFWHGASWNFILWGLLFAVLLLFEKYILHPKRRHAVVMHIYTMLFVVLGFVLFDSTSIADAFMSFKSLFGLAGIPAVNTVSFYYLKSNLVLLIIALLGATPLPKRIYEKIGGTAGGSRVLTVLTPIATVASIAVCTAYLIDGSFNPFVYFRF